LEQRVPSTPLQHPTADAAPLSTAPRPAAGLRIAIVSDAISGRNGVGTYYPDLIHHIRPHVAEVRLIAPQPQPERALEAFALPMPGDRTQRLAWPRRKTLYASLDEIQPNLVIIPTLGPFSYFALRYARRRKLPVAIVTHTNFDDLLALYWPNWVSWPLRQALGVLNRWLCRQATAVAAMSDEGLEQAQRAGARRVRTIGTPLDISFLSTPTTPLPERIGKAIFVGRLAQEKGIGEILAAARALPDMRIAIAGDGPLQNTVRQAAAEHENLTYLGWLPRARVREEIDASEILLLPSAYETFGTVALEALARRRLVVASSQCGIFNWASISEGIFRTTAEKGLTDVISEIQSMAAGPRDEHAGTSWQAVRAFNDRTIQDWLDFLTEAAALK
jgi:glycosyltransferase involved in cell wall biosynthesis